MQHKPPSSKTHNVHFPELSQEYLSDNVQYFIRIRLLLVSNICGNRSSCNPHRVLTWLPSLRITLANKSSGDWACKHSGRNLERKRSKVEVMGVDGYISIQKFLIDSFKDEGEG
jgi:hypothetical protein